MEQKVQFEVFYSPAEILAGVRRPLHYNTVAILMTQETKKVLSMTV